MSYVSPWASATGGSRVEESRASDHCYWHRDLLQGWARAVRPMREEHGDGADGGAGGASPSGAGEMSTVDYEGYMIMSAFVADGLRMLLSLVAGSGRTPPLADDPRGGVCSTLRVGVAIPEGPFLPLFVLAVHSLNVAVSEDWLLLGDHGDDCEASAPRRCGGVVLIPMESDEAPERLRHMLADSSPDLVLVAPGEDMESMENAARGARDSSIRLVDYVQLTEEALASLRGRVKEGGSLATLLWTTDAISRSVDSLRFSHAASGCFDPARLVAAAALRLAGSFSIESSPLRDDHRASRRGREIVSHVVYTSGTTGTPKGCVSSLASLQHYVRAKNLSQEVDRESRVLLASAVTFDPCFSDVLATCAANACICIAPRERLYGRGDDTNNPDDVRGHSGLTRLLRQLGITHVLSTPALWATVDGNPDDVPSLRVVALGGEPIPRAVAARWARVESPRGERVRERPRLYATYGVTEACVYQTCGEVVLNRRGWSGPGQGVGPPLHGTAVLICEPNREGGDGGDGSASPLRPAMGDGDPTGPAVGEVVLSGAQIDAVSSYLNLPELTARVFVRHGDGGGGSGKGSGCFYRTGDLGLVDSSSGCLRVLGRIKGDGMVKINGVRIELAEIENAVIDDDPRSTEEGTLVMNCMAAAIAADSPESSKGASKQLVAYCMLSKAVISQMSISHERLKNGAIVPPGPLLSLLRARCDRRVRKGCTPSFFVLVDRIPLSPTGKRDRGALPPLSGCSMIESLIIGNGGCGSLWKCGRSGSLVADLVCDCLNLQPCQRQLVTKDANFFALGGNSLAATRVARGLYARYHSVRDSRNLGGATGTLAGPFAARFLLRSNNLGDYVEFLDSKLDSRPEFCSNKTGLCDADSEEGSHPSADPIQRADEKSVDPLYESLIEAITLGHTGIASSLLDLDVDLSQPNQGRLGKVTDRKQQRALFASGPLHLACLRGKPHLVKRLLSKGCKATSPDASGSFPIHLACSRAGGKDDNVKEDLERVECVRLLLDYGTPISIKDANKQTILHSAARSGHCELLKYIMAQWKIASETIGIKFKSHGNAPGKIYDWYDRWFRTPVHWAVLNERTSALRIMLDGGCSAFPPKPKSGVSKRSTNVIVETPLEMCMRLYGNDHPEGKKMSCLLRSAKY